MADSTRCPACSSDVSIWAGQCPVCGSPLPQLPVQDLAPAAPADVGHAPRPGRMLLALAGVVVLVVAGLAWRAHDRALGSRAPGSHGLAVPPVTAAVTPGAPGTVLPFGPIARTVVEGTQGRDTPAGLHVFPLDGGVDFTVPVTGGGIPVGFTSIGDAVVFISGGQARTLVGQFVPNSVNRSFQSTSTTLGPADQVLPGANPGQVWLVRYRPPGPVTVQLACVSGSGVSCGGLGPAVAVPAGFSPRAQAGGDLLLAPDQARSAPVMWDPSAGGFVYRFPASFGDVVGTWQNLVAWREACPPTTLCPIHLTDIQRPGEDRLVPPAPGTTGYLAGGAFSLDGAYLAAFTADPTDARSTRPVMVRVAASPAILEVTMMTPRLASNSLGGDRAVWDPAAYLVFVSGPDGAMFACRPDGSLPLALTTVAASIDFAIL